MSAMTAMSAIPEFPANANAGSKLGVAMPHPI